MHDIRVERLATIYMKEFYPKIRQYTLTNYFTYEYYNKVDITYYESEFSKVIKTLEFKISSDMMVDKIIKENSIKDNITKLD